MWAKPIKIISQICAQRLVSEAINSSHHSRAISAWVRRNGGRGNAAQIG